MRHDPFVGDLFEAVKVLLAARKPLKHERIKLRLSPRVG
jgi:hypothetical protein